MASITWLASTWQTQLKSRMIMMVREMMIMMHCNGDDLGSPIPPPRGELESLFMMVVVKMMMQVMKKKK